MPELLERGSVMPQAKFSRGMVDNSAQQKFNRKQMANKFVMRAIFNSLSSRRRIVLPCNLCII